MPRVYTPEWSAEHHGTKFPFAAAATLQSEEGTELSVEMFHDAALYPIGGTVPLWLSELAITHDTVTLYLSDPLTDRLASGSFSLTSPPELIRFVDSYGRPAGVLVGEPLQLAGFQAWGLGTHRFLPEATELAATCCEPRPEIGLRGILLDDGTLLTGDVWLIGGDGVRLGLEHAVQAAACRGASQLFEVIRVDVLGDPLFQRRLCEASDLFQTPRLLRTITVQRAGVSFTCGPDDSGDFKLQLGNNLAADTALRVRTTAGGILIEAVGSPLGGAQP